MKKALYILFPIFLLSAGLVFAADEGNEPGMTPTQTRLAELGFQVFKEKVEAPEISLKSITGGISTLSSFRGKVVVLNFWATWCPPCRAEMPSMQRMYDELGDEGIDLIAVDLQESEKTVKDFLDKNDYTFPVLLDTDGRAGATYGARSIPTSFVIDTEGYAVAMVVGSREWDTDEIYAMLRSMVPDSE
jgi:cytochrome c biogenesis protein CcmG, thiol:disulfide interchange protein DsbE